MSNVDILIQNSLIDRTAELVITNTYWKILYRNSVLDFKDEQWSKWIIPYANDPVDEKGMDWEIADSEQGIYYKVHTFRDFYHGELSLVHHIYDVSDYAGLFRELSEYSKEWRRMSACQSEIISNLSSDPVKCLPIAIRFFGSKQAVLYVERNGAVIRTICCKDDPTPESSLVKDADYHNEPGTVCELSDMGGGRFKCCCSANPIPGSGYGLYISVDDEEMTDEDTRLQSVLSNEFQLYIENALLRDHIEYENEHDQLTGLYNRAKYNEMASNLFPFCDRIAIFNMDLNYLKRTNDMYGHEAGNTLLITAGQSISEVIGENIYGYRVGGDEFLIVAVNMSESDAYAFRDRWYAGLERLNKNGARFECVMACGLAWAEKPYDFKALSQQADDLMYEDKRNIKISRGEDPDSR